MVDPWVVVTIVLRLLPAEVVVAVHLEVTVTVIVMGDLSCSFGWCGATCISSRVSG